MTSKCGPMHPFGCGLNQGQGQGDEQLVSDSITSICCGVVVQLVVQHVVQQIHNKLFYFALLCFTLFHRTCATARVGVFSDALSWCAGMCVHVLRGVLRSVAVVPSNSA